MTVQERAREICRRLARDVESIVPTGIGRWARAWEIVADADASFIGALAAWEGDPTNERAKQRVRDSYAGVLEAWRHAVAEYERSGAER